jgi:hypothetical protein
MTRRYAFGSAVRVVVGANVVGTVLIYLGNRWWRAVDAGLAEFGDADDVGGVS